MFVLAHILRGLALLVQMVCSIFYFILVIRIIISWLDVNPYNEFVQIIYRITEPILAPLRRLPLHVGRIDFSPIIAFIILFVVSTVIVGILQDAAIRLR